MQPLAGLHLIAWAAHLSLMVVFLLALAVPDDTQRVQLHLVRMAGRLAVLRMVFLLSLRAPEIADDRLEEPVDFL